MFRELLDKAYSTFRQCGETEKLVESLNTLGNAQLTHGKYEEALRYYKNALDVIEQSPFEEIITYTKSEWQAIINGNRGIVLGRQGYFDEACDKLYQIQSDLFSVSDHAEAYAILAYYEYQRGNPEQAYKMRLQAEQIMRQLGISDPVCEEDRLWRELVKNHELAV